jgi:hypothetical protein
MSPMNRFLPSFDRLTYSRRALARLVGLLALILPAGLPAPAPAGTIYFHYAGGTNPPAPAGLYSVSDSGTTAPVLLAAGSDFAGPFFNGVSIVPSWKAYTNPVPDNPATRRWLAVRPQWTDPNTGIQYGELAYFTLDANGNATTVQITDFASSGALIPTSGWQVHNMFALNWSNDGQDRFVSFTVLDPASNSQRHVRLNIAGDQLPTPANPYLVTPADPRVQTVLRSSPYNYYAPILMVSWRADGTKLSYHFYDPDLNYSQLRIKSVGPQGTDDTLMPETVLLDNRTTTTGASFVYPRWSPTADRIIFNDSGGTLYAINAVVGASPQLLLSKSPGACQRANWSPDGGSVAFDSYSYKGQPFVGHATYQIQKAVATGGKNVSAVSLTTSLDPSGTKVMAAWRP